MTTQEGPKPESYKVLIVDDEPDIFQITKLSLKGLKHGGRAVDLLGAASGKEALELMRKHPDIAVVLLDVVMETDSAGLVACRSIRGELKNHFVRILLRTGQPGVAPERQTIDDYDIDGYLPKAEISSTKLYSAVRTALRAYSELIELERHRSALTSMQACATELRSFAPLSETLERVLQTVVSICPAPLAVLSLETFEELGNPKRYLLQTATGDAASNAQTDAEAIRAAVASARAQKSLSGPTSFGKGFVVPLVLHRELGHGWLYVAVAEPDELVRRLLPMLAAQVATAIYASVAQAMLTARQGPAFDAMAI
jgi:CheY-like chemotaxis protein